MGDGETVTAQIPAAGESLPGGSQVILYFGEPPETRTVTVPDFTGMTRQQASDAAGKLGLYILVSGNMDIAPSVIVSWQKVSAGTQLPAGSTIELRFTDMTAAD